VTGERYEIKFQAAARRAVAERLPESVAAAVLEFCEAALAVSPRRAGKPLFGPLAGCHGARRGTYRIVYRIDEQAHTVQVLDIDHRADIYHRPLRGRQQLGSVGDGLGAPRRHFRRRVAAPQAEPVTDTGLASGFRVGLAKRDLSIRKARRRQRHRAARALTRGARHCRQVTDRFCVSRMRHRRRKGEPKGFSWQDYRDLIIATHRQLARPAPPWTSNTPGRVPGTASSRHSTPVSGVSSSRYGQSTEVIFAAESAEVTS
jgi:mRNA-degrading endonuclease RelE of RelBE toxin-antitoxin system